MAVNSIDAEDDQFAYRYDTQLLIERRDQDLVKIHFHTNEPWKILEYCNSVWIDLRQLENKDEDDEDCNSFYLENESGVGNITLYQVFPGIELVYNDMHLAYCSK